MDRQYPDNDRFYYPWYAIATSLTFKNNYNYHPN